MGAGGKLQLEHDACGSELDGRTYTAQLRVRAVATFPWIRNGKWEISAARRCELQDALSVSELADAVTMLSRRRGASLRAAQWRPGPNRNALDAVSYSSIITTPDGRPALSAEVMMALPNSLASSVVTCAELRVEDAIAWADALRAEHVEAAGEGLLLSLEELFEILTVAWQTATEVLPALAAADPYGGRWADPPTVELRLSAEQQHGTPGPRQQLRDLVDFAAFGDRDGGQLTEMAVTITAPPRLSQPARRDLTRQAMVYMGQAFGFLEATENRL